MSFKVLVHPDAFKAIARLPESHQKKLTELVEVLKGNPVPYKRFDIRKLKGDKRDKNLFRARIGDFRLVYEVDKKDRLILILKLDQRGRVYR
ncbi:MAG TPA: type II toxin-antitoxin system RelE/ParE family toxin [Candidatus Syntrophoarchaeum butanivorans]|uniref:Type II toxin-antitoxin system RelE/ParE family toxin n=1 Tax=Candidatus Syntropharchaeum butanivorans TaxID=1839936 RepID=A0A7J2RZ42_9EURY|nr:type II toxin-antitoxin system RelE/ParE family toxin [Candidatus Syntrophoarchaeum butanivorans]